MIRLLLQDNILGKNKEYIQKMFIFIDHILLLPEEEDLKLIHEIKPIIEKEETLMALSMENTSLARYYKKEAYEKGIEKGIQQGITEGEKQKALEVAYKLLKRKVSIEEVVDITGLSVEEVAKLSES